MEEADLWLSPHGSVRTALVTVGALIASAILQLAFATQARASAPKPATDASYYITTSDPNTLYQLGCNQGQFDLNNGWINSTVILDFGGQRSDNTGTYLPLNNAFMSYATIESLSEQFARGYWVCTGRDTTSLLDLQIGTNNGWYSSYQLGQTWSAVAATVENWVKTYIAQVLVGGASDMEPGFTTTPVYTKAWVDGYGNGPGTNVVMLDYGSADGCPQYSYNNGACNSGWHQFDVWYVSWWYGADFPAPEIYYQSQANQWVQISLYSSRIQGVSMSFWGPLDENDRAPQTFTSQQAWDAVWNGLNNSGLNPNMKYSMEIH